MAFRLTVAGSLEPLADVLAAELEQPASADPFAPETVVIPGDGVRTWLNARLAHRVGATAAGADGVVANLRVVFPATVVREALGEESGLGRWAVGPLGWAIHHVAAEQGGSLEIEADPVRARAVADLFDRYSLHRPSMVVRWSRGHDVDALGAPLPPHHVWQPRLWRAVQEHLGGRTDVERTLELAAALRSGVSPPALTGTPRLFVFGLASLPPLHLDVLTALSHVVDVHALAPTPSPGRWRTVRTELVDPLRLPLARADVHVPVREGHPLVTTWGRTSREAHLLLLDAAQQLPGAVVEPPSPPSASATGASLLEQLQIDLRDDRTPTASGPNGDGRLRLADDDHSIEWHLGHGTARQVEILRDVLLHLLEEVDADGAPRYEPRDVAVLCPDVATVAPFVEAVFAGDPEHGLPAVPVQVADRSLRHDDPLLDAVGALLDLLDGRFRSSAVLAFASRPAVQRRFGLDADAIGRLSEWAESTNVRWGLDPDDQVAFGLPDDLGAHTWLDGLDQLLVGVAMTADGERLGPGEVAPYATVRPDEIDTLGAAADLIDALRRATAELRRPSTVDRWSEALGSAAANLCAVDDEDGWRWGALDAVIETFRAEADVDGSPRTDVLDAADLVALLRRRLAGSPGRPRFGTGAVTVSSLTAQRGVQHRVVCILGLDDDVATGELTNTEDLTSDPPCVGDRDARSEQRAQLLDAVLAAGERLLLISNGHDLRTNTAVPPAVALAELLDVLDSTATTADGRPVRDQLAVRHPRQSWAPAAFRPGALGVDGPWSFDATALQASLMPRSTGESTVFLPVPLAPVPDDGPVTVDELVAAATNPAEVLLRRRLGVARAPDPDDRHDRIPLELNALERWKLTDALLEARLGPEGPWSDGRVENWERHERRRGALPPAAFGNEPVDDARVLTGHMAAVLAAEFGGLVHAPVTAEVQVHVPTGSRPGFTLEGGIAGVCDSTLVEVTASKIRAKHLLSAWVRLAALVADRPELPWAALAIGRHPKKDGLLVVRTTIRDRAAALDVLRLIDDLRRRALCDAVPFFPRTSRDLHDSGPSAARTTWEGMFGDREDRWGSAVFPQDFDDLRAESPRPDETGPGWPEGHTRRLDLWADRVWGALAATAVVTEEHQTPLAEATP